MIRYHAFVRVRFRAVRDIKLRKERKRIARKKREREGKGEKESEKRNRMTAKIGDLSTKDDLRGDYNYEKEFAPDIGFIEEKETKFGIHTYM